MAQITATFDDRDSANLGLMRLRRGGIDFSLIKMTSSTEENSTQSCITYPLCFGKIGSITETSKTEMKISVKANQLHKAIDIMQSTGASKITSI